MQETRGSKSIKSYLRRLIAISFAISIVSVALGLQNSTPKAAERSTLRSHSSKLLPKTIEIGLLGGDVRVALTVGDSLRVVLPNQPTGVPNAPAAASGWQIISDNHQVLEPESMQTLPSTSSDGQGPETGVARHESLHFLAKAPGRTILRLQAKGVEPGSTSSRKDVIIATVTDAANGSGPHPGPVVTPPGKRVATYSSLLPCADCSGIRTRITLYGTGRRRSGGYYVRTMTYLDAPHGDSTFVEAGRWSVKKEQRRTTSPNVRPSVSRVIDSFHSNTPEHRDDYEYRGATLVPLGSDGKPIQSPFNMDLHKEQ